MDEKRLRGLMGLCVRAGQAVFGEDGCRKAISTGECGILLTDSGMSANTRKRYEGWCQAAGVRMAELPEGLLFEATGKPGVAMAVREGSFAEQIGECFDPAGSTKGLSDRPLETFGR